MLIEMMVLDGLFMIELFRNTSRLALVPFEANDPLVTMVLIFPLLYRDFIRLENQILYFILECLFKRTKDVVLDIDRCYLARVFDDVYAYYCNSWHVQWANYKHLYFNFDTPWSFVSVLAAVLLLAMTLIQTLYTVYGFYAPNGP